ncbi:SulP family inorganic anion transporter [Catellatospora bangladeshensis]|uniref:SulP family inorganic anion transporter n=1 Tax=Catellatospora bangladeshensis TaxID=310355 RepID=UPI00361A0C20
MSGVAAACRNGWDRVSMLLPGPADWTAMRRQPRRDLLAGLTVAVVALPLALGFGVSSGLGAAAGLATAIVAGAAAALLGGSNLQVSGPTGAMTVVLVPIVHRFGPGGVLTVGLIAGVLLVALALARAGRYVRYVPAPVVEGFTAGIAAVIFLQQVPAALGVATPEGRRSRSWRGTRSPTSPRIPDGPRWGWRSAWPRSC